MDRKAVADAAKALLVRSYPDRSETMLAWLESACPHGVTRANRDSFLADARRAIDHADLPDPDRVLMTEWVEARASSPLCEGMVARGLLHGDASMFPPCVAPVITRFVALCGPLGYDRDSPIHKVLVGTREPALDERRFWMISDWLVRALPGVWLPAALSRPIDLRHVEAVHDEASLASALEKMAPLLGEVAPVEREPSEADAILEQLFNASGRAEALVIVQRAIGDALAQVDARGSARPGDTIAAMLLRGSLRSGAAELCPRLALC